MLNAPKFFVIKQTRGIVQGNEGRNKMIFVECKYACCLCRWL